ncbi:MAG: aldo/keto reductase, partial [Victivallaceae bacterium]|nr:aldo/keto reductase [Victivallaceae bacterium]
MKFSRLMLGTVQFGLNYGIANSAGKPSYEIVRKIISTAYDHGVNCLDTAAGYGDSEEILGRVLDELNLKNKMLLISKVPNLIQHGFSERDAEKFIVDSVERSLTKLGIESLAVGMFHSEQDIKYLRIMKKLEKQGLINGVGISLDSNRYCNEVIAAGIKYVQIPYNVLDQRFDEFLSKALESGITIFTRSIYLQGLLLMPEKA